MTSNTVQILKGSKARTVLAITIYDALKERIMDQIVAPGERLNMDALALELKVSQTPIREALARLSAEGLISFEPYRGYTVSPFPTSRELAELIHARRLLEGDAVRLTTMRISPISLNASELVLGTGLSAPTAQVAGATCSASIDFIWIDTEHALYGAEAIDAIAPIIRMRGVAPVIRVAWNDPALIKKAYDVGAVAVMVPQVNTVEKAKRAVEYAHYPPLGQRGISPSWPHVAGMTG